LIKFANFREYDEIPTPNLNLLYCYPFSRLYNTIDRAAHGYILLAAYGDSDFQAQRYANPHKLSYFSA